LNGEINWPWLDQRLVCELPLTNKMTLVRTRTGWKVDAGYASVQNYGAGRCDPKKEFVGVLK
jgi:hypothetical protein